MPFALRLWPGQTDEPSIEQQLDTFETELRAEFGPAVEVLLTGLLQPERVGRRACLFRCGDELAVWYEFVELGRVTLARVAWLVPRLVSDPPPNEMIEFVDQRLEEWEIS